MKSNFSHCTFGWSVCRFILVLALLLPFVGSAAYADDVEIAKNDSNYYEIGTAAQLKAFAELVNSGTDNKICGVLTADIDVSTLGEDYWTPIGRNFSSDGAYHVVPFEGKFNGQGHTVSGLVLRRSSDSGLFGYAEGATIRNVTVSGAQLKVTASTEMLANQLGIAAICGTAAGGTLIENCHSVLTEILYKVENDSKQKPISYVGGIVGSLSKSTVKDCTVNGYVRADGQYVGGIAGNSRMSLISGCQMLNWDGGHSSVVGTDFVGGIVGRLCGRSAAAAVKDCSVADECVVKATAGTADTICGGFTAITNEDDWKKYSVSDDGVYEIYTPDQLNWYRDIVNGGNSSAKAKLMQDINMSQAGTFTPIGTESNNFSGEFDGQEYTIDSLTVNGQKYAGLFGYVCDGAIRNVNLNHPYISTSNDYLGFIAGFMTQNGGEIDAVVENCHVTDGNLDGYTGKGEYVGGLVGKAEKAAAISDCSFSGWVAPHGKYVGGVAGELNSGATIARCYIVGGSTLTDASQNKYGTTVWGDNYVGGVVGNMEDTNTSMADCYADQTKGAVTIHISSGNYSGLICGYDKSGTSDTHNTYSEGGLNYQLTGRQVQTENGSAKETKIVGMASKKDDGNYAIVDIGSSSKYFTTEIESVDGVETLYFWDNCSNLAGTEACGWINMKIDDYAFGSGFKSLKMYIKMFAGDDHCVMLRPSDVRPAGKNMFGKCPDAKVYVDAEYYDEFCTDSVWSQYKDHLVPVTWMRTEDVNAEYGARYAYDRNRDRTGSVAKNGNVHEVHVIGIENNYVNDNSGTAWIYQDIGQTYDYNTTKIWASAFNGKDNLKQVKFQEITKSGRRASQDLCIAIGDSAFANCKELSRFEVALYSDQGKDHVEFIRPSQLPIGKGVFDGSTRVKIYIPRELLNTFQNDTTYGWAQYKDLMEEGDFGSSDWTEQGVIYSYYTSADGQTRYTNSNNSEMKEMLDSWSAYYRNFTPMKVLEYGNSSTIKYVFASGVDESKITDNKGVLKIFSDIGEYSPNHYKTLALSASGFQNKTSIKSIIFEDIVANNYNTVTDFSLVIPGGTFKGCANLKELNMFMLVTKGTNHYVAIKPSQVFIGEHAFDGVNEDFRIRVLPEYYDDFVNDENWSRYKNYIVAADYLPTDKKEVECHGVTYDYATKVLNGMTTTQVVQMKSSYWNALIIGVEAALALYSGGTNYVAPKVVDAIMANLLRTFGKGAEETISKRLLILLGKTLGTLMVDNGLEEHVATTLATKIIGATLATLDAGFAVGMNAGVPLTNLASRYSTPINYVINRTKKTFERPDTWKLSGQWLSTEQITNVPHLYVKSVSDDNTAVTIYNDCGTGNNDYQTVAVAYDAFHNKTKLKKLEFKERYGEDSRSLASGLTIALPDSMFKGCTSFEELNLVNTSTGAHSENHCKKALTPDNFIPMGDIFAGLDSTARSKIHIVVGEEVLQDFLEDDYWSQYKDMFQTEGVRIVRKQLEWSCNYALAYNKNTLPLRTTVSTHDIDHVMVYSGDDDQLDSNGGLAALINDFGEWNNYKLDYVKNDAFKGNDHLKILDICDTHTNVADVYTDFDVILQDSAFAHCKNFTDLNLIYQVTTGSNHTETMAPSQFTLGRGVFDDTPNLKIKFCLDQENAFLADTAWAKYKDKFAPCFFEPVDEKVGDILLDPYRFLTKLNDGTNFKHVDATRATPAVLRHKFNGTSIQSFDEFRAFGCCGLDTIYNGMFKDCSSLQTIMLPDSIRSIETDAFNGCSLLRDLTIPAKVSTIGENAFTGSGITKFTMASAVPADIDAAKAFAGLNDSTYIIYVPDSAVTDYKTKWAAVADHINGISQRRGLVVVKLDEAGTLAEKLGLTYDYTENIFSDNHLKGNYAQYDSLRIIGPLDGRDIGVLRYMGGRDVEYNRPTIGKLQYLDLYEADLKSDGGYTYNRSHLNKKWYDGVGWNNNKIEHDNEVSYFMFWGLNSLRTLILPRSATSIKVGAFEHCENLETLVIGDNMTDIAKEVDESYVALSTPNKTLLVMLADKVPETDDESFAPYSGTHDYSRVDGAVDWDDTDNSAKFNLCIVPANSVKNYAATPGYTSACDSIMGNFEDQALVEALKKKHVFSLFDLANVSDIRGYVNSNKDIRKFDDLYMSSVTTLGDSTLTDMSSLQTVTLPVGLEKITTNAFKGCTSLKTVNAFSLTVPELEKDAFESLPEDFVVWVAEGTEDTYREKWEQYKDHIQGYRSSGRVNIREITLKEPNTLADSLNAIIYMDDEDVVAVGGDLGGISGLKINGPIGSKDVAVIRYLGGREPNNNMHVYTTNLKYLDLYDANLKADAYDFKLDGIDRSIDNDNEIPKDMLAQCDNLETVILPRTATKLCYEACYDMASLKKLVIGDDVTEIDDDALGDNRKLTDIIFLCSSKPKLDDDAFTDPVWDGDDRKVERMYVRKELSNDYTADKEYTTHANQITSGFSDINLFRAFGCKAIATEDDLSGVTSVDGWFDNFPGITSLDKLKKTMITSLAKNTLAKTTKLENISLPGTLAKIDGDAFKENTALHWADLSACDSLKTDITTLGIAEDALLYAPQTLAQGTATNIVYGNRCAEYKLTDAHVYDVPKAFTAEKVTFGRKFATDAYTTLTLPFRLSDVPEGFKFYAIDAKNTKSGELHFKGTTKVEANVPYVVKAETETLTADEEVAVPVSTTRADYVTAEVYRMYPNLQAYSAKEANAQSMLVMGNDQVWNVANAETDSVAPYTAYVKAINTETATANVKSVFKDLTYFYTLGGKKHMLEGDAESISDPLQCDDFNLVDGNDFESEYPFVANRAVYTRTMNTTWGTLCLPYAFEAEGNETCEFYEMTEKSSSSVVLSKLTGTVEAGRPVVVRRRQEGTDVKINAAEVDVSVAPAEDNAMTGTFAKIEVPSGAYIISKDKFWLVSGTQKATVGAYRGYLNSSFASGAKVSSFDISVGDEATAIDELNAMTDDANVEYYDLQGRRHDSLQKGINIIKNGNRTMKVTIK